MLPLWLSWRIHLQCRRPWFNSWVGQIHWRRDRLSIPEFLGFPCGSAGKESACSEGNLGSIAGLGRSPGEGKGYPFQYSGLENSMDYVVHGVRKSIRWIIYQYCQYCQYCQYYQYCQHQYCLVWYETLQMLHVLLNPDIKNETLMWKIAESLQ